MEKGSMDMDAEMSMEANQACIGNNDFLSEIQPHFEYTLKTIGGKWKMRIICVIIYQSVARYGELKRMIDGITDKMLSAQLKELEQDGIVIRKTFDQIPPRVEYSLSERGITLLPILKAMFEWGKQNNRADEKEYGEMQ